MAEHHSFALSISRVERLGLELVLAGLLEQQPEIGDRADLTDANQLLLTGALERAIEALPADFLFLGLCSVDRGLRIEFLSHNLTVDAANRRVESAARNQLRQASPSSHV